MSTKIIKIKFDEDEFFMSKTEKYIVSMEIFKYFYCGTIRKSIELEEFLSGKICCYTIGIQKKIVRKTKRVFVYRQLIFSLSNVLAPTQAISLPILAITPSIIRSIRSTADLSNQAIIAQVL